MAIKVLHVFNSINHSGAEIMYEAAASIFIENGFKLYALSTGKEIGDFVDRFEKAGYTVFFSHEPKNINSLITSVFSLTSLLFISYSNVLKLQLYIFISDIFSGCMLWWQKLQIQIYSRTVHSVFKPRFYRWPAYL